MPPLRASQRHFVAFKERLQNLFKQSTVIQDLAEIVISHFGSAVRQKRLRRVVGRLSALTSGTHAVDAAGIAMMRLVAFRAAASRLRQAEQSLGRDILARLI